MARSRKSYTKNKAADPVDRLKGRLKDLIAAHERATKCSVTRRRVVVTHTVVCVVEETELCVAPPRVHRYYGANGTVLAKRVKR